MAKGKLLRTKLKETYYQTKKKWRAYFSEKEAHYKRNKFAWPREILTGMLKNVDPVKTAAILGSTIIVHEVIFKGNEFLEGLKHVEILGKDVQDNPVTKSLWDFFMNALGQKSPIVEPDTGKEVYVFGGLLSNDLFLWLEAFAIAYFAVEHGAELLSVAKSTFGIGILA